MYAESGFYFWHTFFYHCKGVNRIVGRQFLQQQSDEHRNFEQSTVTFKFFLCLLRNRLSTFHLSENWV